MTTCRIKGCTKPVVEIVAKLSPDYPERDDKGQLWAVWTTVDSYAGCSRHLYKGETETESYGAYIHRLRQGPFGWLFGATRVWKQVRG